MANLLKFIDMDKYILLYQFFNNNNLPNDVLIYIVDLSIPFDKHIIDNICNALNFNNIECMFFCNNIFDKITHNKIHELANENINEYYFNYFKYFDYCIVDSNNRYIVYIKNCITSKNGNKYIYFTTYHIIFKKIETKT